MKRILLSVALPLAIVAVAWQFAPADVENEVDNGVVTAVDPVPGKAANRETSPGNPSESCGKDFTTSTRPDDTLDYQQLLRNNPGLIEVLIDNYRPDDNEHSEFIQMSLVSMGGAAVPELLKILLKTDNEQKKELIVGVLGFTALFPKYPIDEVMPTLISLSRSEDETERQLGLTIMTQVLYLQAMPPELRAAQRTEVLTEGLGSL